MRKVLVIMLLVLAFTQIVYAAPTKAGYALYNSTDETCIVDGPFGDEFGSIELGWKNFDEAYYSMCPDWYDPSCCENICDEYNRETKECLLAFAILEAHPEDSPSLNWIYSLAILILVIGAVIFFKKRGGNKK